MSTYRKARGVVLRDTAAGSGLLMVEGRQRPFHLEGLWRSPVAPKADMAVEVTFDQQDQVVAIRALTLWMRCLAVFNSNVKG